MTSFFFGRGKETHRIFPSCQGGNRWSIVSKNHHRKRNQIWLVDNLWCQFYNDEGRKKFLKFLKVDISLLLLRRADFYGILPRFDGSTREEIKKGQRFLKQIDCWLSFFLLSASFPICINPSTCLSLDSILSCIHQMLRLPKSSFVALCFCAKTNNFWLRENSIFSWFFSGHHHFDRDGNLLRGGRGIDKRFIEIFDGCLIISSWDTEKLSLNAKSLLFPQSLVESYKSFPNLHLISTLKQQ